jgi:hypothetical protein
MPECAPDRTHMGQEGLREAGSGAKTGLEEPHGPRLPETYLALDAKRALCSPSLRKPEVHGSGPPGGNSGRCGHGFARKPEERRCG